MNLPTRLTMSALALALAAPLCSAATISAGEMVRPEGARHYLLAQPAQATPGLLPLIILLHGHGSSAAFQLGKEGILGWTVDEWTTLADREHLLLIAPDGIKGSDGKQGWNDCRADAPTNPGADDSGFLAALIARAVAELHADPARVYVFGSSHGGSMAYRMAIEHAPLLAAIGVQSALGAANSKCAAPAQPLSLIELHGTKDPIVPYLGGEVKHWSMSGRGSGLSTDATLAQWRALAHLPATPVTTTRYSHLDTSDATTATRMVWGSDPRQLQVAHIRIDGGGHTGASRGKHLPWAMTMVLGDENHDITMADEFWTFFKDKRAGLLPAAAAP